MPTVAAYLPQLHYLILLCLIVLLFKPVKIKAKPHYSTIKWLLSIFLIQLFVMLMLKQTADLPILFPWTAYLILTILFLIYRKSAEQVTTVMQCLKHMKIAEGASILIDNHFRLGMIYALAIALALLVMVCSQHLATFLNISLQPGFTLQNMIVSSVFLFASVTKPWQKVTRWLALQRYPLIVPLGLEVICLIIALLGSSTVIPLISKDIVLELPALTIKADNQVIVWTWLLAITPAVAHLIAKLSFGRSIRSIILVNLLFPVLFFIYNYFPLPIIPHSILTIIAFFILLLILWRYRSIKIFMFSQFSLSGESKIQRNEVMGLRALMQSTLIATAVYLVSGFSLIYFVAFAIALPLLIILFIASFYLLVLLLRVSSWPASQNQEK